MKENLIRWLEIIGFPNSDRAYLLIVIALIVLVAVLIHFVLHRVVLRETLSGSPSSPCSWSSRCSMPWATWYRQ